ncbi:nitrite reductase small subunit NirD [Alkalihalobacillus sp. LMS39]|uniref:nitrite reductase small subunit NirD n=1 Tax=Alkalihalobacillus sp. LMS39 TaxID=2924032 RepID=UPI001FB36FAE|nr:nitrite reductase small subunit NirD [Alkalihalobacillus sp. LMS39]UOE92064.1 nitrite reductase small subunit NirD [Alkalihalobacillus sp. LMS39]
MMTKTKINIGSLRSFPVEIGQSIKIGDEEIAIFRLDNNRVYAVENRSPHPKGGIISEGLVSGEFVFCPLYDWKISLKTGEVQTPDEGAIRTFEVEISNENVYITL